MPNYSKINDPLSSAQVEQFRSRGFVVLDLGLNEGQLQSIIDKVEPLYPEDRLQNPTAPARVQDAWKHVEEVRELAISPTVLGALEQLFGRAALPFQTLNFPIGTRQRTHSDTVHFDSRPSGFMAGSGWPWRISISRTGLYSTIRAVRRCRFTPCKTLAWSPVTKTTRPMKLTSMNSWRPRA